MTALQIQYHNLAEQQRANMEKEHQGRISLSETERSNLAKEKETARSNLAEETETQRHNRMSEYRDVAKLALDGLGLLTGHRNKQQELNIKLLQALFGK